MKKIRIHPSLCLLLVIPVMGLIYTLINREPQLVRTLYTDNNDGHTIVFPAFTAYPVICYIWLQEKVRISNGGLSFVLG